MTETVKLVETEIVDDELAEVVLAVDTVAATDGVTAAVRDAVPP